MIRSAFWLALPVPAAVAIGLLAASPAQAAPSCVAQSIQAEHASFGPAWGHDLISFLATHPDVLQEFGFQNYGALAAFAAHQNPAACPPDL